jgi:hypothetical protein
MLARSVEPEEEMKLGTPTKSTMSAVAVALALTGCAPATIEGVRQAPAGHETLVLEQGYQQAYRTVVTNARRCYQTGMITAQMVVTGDLYSDTQSGQITVALHGAVGVDTYLGVDIKALSDQRSQVDSYVSLSSWKPALGVVKRWLTEGSTECK